MTKAFDVIVVGSGPGGSTVARELTEGGVSTLLLDKQEFPRDKPCGGGITARTAALLPFGIEPVAERVISTVRFSYRMGNAASYTYHRPLVYMTQRSRFDALLVEKALEAGVTFQDKSPVRAIEVDSRGVTVRSGQEVFTAGLVIGADGANGIVGRVGGLDRHAMAVAYEGNAHYGPRLSNEWSQTFGLDLGSIPGGYGWIFPKGDHVNVGIGGWRQVIGSHLRAHISTLSRYYRVPENDLFGLRGHHLPMRRLGERIAGDRILLVGDAAGMVDPLSGEGIYGAIRSAQIAAPHAMKYLSGDGGSLLSYEREIDRLMMPEMEASRRLQYVFHYTPGIYMRLFHLNPFFWNAFCRVVCGETTFDRIIAKLGPFGRVFEGWSDIAHRKLGVVADT